MALPPRGAASDGIRRVAVAVSGGCDSTALWHATARAARELGALHVVALHVHHGLQPQADAWLATLRAQARRWAAAGLPVSLCWRRLATPPAARQSLEAWARRERYAALADMARSAGIDLVLLAHHRRDQAETFLLQALRGAGPAGLAAMPRAALRGGIRWARPWLEQPRESIEAYLRRHRLGHVEDPSNADTRRARNALRHGVWPALAAHFAQAEASLAASAQRAQEAAACLKELAELDLHQSASAGGSLDLGAWRRLSAPRRANLLRAWLAQACADGVPETLLRRLCAELPAAHAGAWPLRERWLRLHAGRLQVGDEVTPALAPPGGLAVALDACGLHELPAWGGAFEVRSVASGGVAAARLRGVELRMRQGGERWQRAAGGVPRSLKKQFQAAGVPAWERDGPLVFVGEALVFVPGLGIDARQLAPPGEPMRELRWLARPPGKP